MRWMVVGAFSKSLKGGTSKFCNLLFDDSVLHTHTFYRIDSTLDVIPKDLPFIRMLKSFIKFRKFFYGLFRFRAEGVMLFTGHGMGLMEKCLMLCIAKLAGKRTLFFPRSGLVMDSNVDRWILRRAMRMADKLVCQSVFWQDYMHSLHPSLAYKTALIYNGIDTSGINLSSQETIAHSPFRLLFVGWLEQYKGLGDLMEVVKKLNDLSPGAFELNILGKGSMENEIYHYKRQFPQANIHLLGWLNDASKDQYFKSANVLVLPSHFEGFPNVILEAMYHGLPVIASDISSMPEILDNGNCGLLFEAGNREQLKAAILKVKNSPEDAQKRALAGKIHVAHKFNIDQSREQLLTLLQTL